MLCASPQVLCQEMLRYNRLLAIIRTSLLSLDKALAGLQVMSSELDTVFRWVVRGVFRWVVRGV